jgi:hypothetical protein
MSGLGCAIEKVATCAHETKAPLKVLELCKHSHTAFGTAACTSNAPPVYALASAHHHPHAHQTTFTQAPSRRHKYPPECVPHNGPLLC